MRLPATLNVSTWVWEFGGHHLRPVAHYAADDAAQVIAAAW
jgi:hypothetical protein